MRFDHVRLEPVQVLQAPGATPTARATLRSQVAQLIMTNLYLGIAQGAYQDARGYVRDAARPWFASGVERHADDPYVQERFGEFWLSLQAARALADQAAQALDALARGPSVTAEERGRVAVAGAQAKVLAHRAALSVGAELFDDRRQLHPQPPRPGPPLAQRARAHAARSRGLQDPRPGPLRAAGSAARTHAVFLTPGLSR